MENKKTNREEMEFIRQRMEEAERENEKNKTFLQDKDRQVMEYKKKIEEVYGDNKSKEKELYRLEKENAILLRNIEKNEEKVAVLQENNETMSIKIQEYKTNLDEYENRMIVLEEKEKKHTKKKIQYAQHKEEIKKAFENLQLILQKAGFFP